MNENANDAVSPARAAEERYGLLFRPRSNCSPTVLLVEDEVFVRNAAARILEAAGYEVIAAANAEEAMKICLVRPEPIDLLLSDFILPGMSGWELADKFSEMFPESCVLTMSGYVEKMGENSTLRWQHLAKPFSAAELLQKAREALENRISLPAEFRDNAHPRAH